mmetsp:Transcript_36281/g.117296  ORF Transcript_36281/g.117296 Transcript_36281/m.117296 type:complete len:379 (+) Transcript_36281:139-1275(+)|eukprot:CAMPEP_0203894254 /NCGR_PEP_ID=MMETSP0359-20131031/37247_1 /ASSEMBLY_ACC=CAM_ASM_000338 /TAXON_ID=268821 /ORGANISM="Scrippsiella Hangoei, Strain SHTV-5" /LENGTH=378 /DNA_ID=CAMNT_0050816529 /DNA_START=87 /DNA_END=1223 /DNA_ORIENTATION=+
MSASFDVATGCCKGSYDAVLISTDLEPDDALALSVLAPRLRGVPTLVVVGEAPVDKRRMAAEILASYGIDSGVVVVQGKMSKVTFPNGVSEAYHNLAQPHSCTLREGGEAAVQQHVECFLQQHERPFALLLKPPHEFLSTPEPLLKKTKAALYGSFNLGELRSSIKAAAGGAMDEAAQHAAQFELMAKFGTLLWIERSASVGRDCVLEPAACPPAIWEAIDADASLTKHIQLWNSQTIRNIAGNVSGFADDVEAAIGPVGDEATTSVTDAEGHKKLRPMIERLDKCVQILLSISTREGRQACHADTLVAAVLLDDDGAVTKFERACKLEVDAQMKPTFAADPTSRVFALVADPGEQREELIKASFDKLATGFAALTTV